MTRHITMVLDNLHVSDEILNFLVQADVDIHADALGCSARFHRDFPHDSTRKKSRQEFCVDLCGKWRTYVRSYIQCIYVQLLLIRMYTIYRSGWIKYMCIQILYTSHFQVAFYPNGVPYYVHKSYINRYKHVYFEGA